MHLVPLPPNRAARAPLGRCECYGKAGFEGSCDGTGHRQASSINFGSIEANQAPEKKAEVATPPPTAPTPATAPAATSKPAPAPVSPATPTATQPSTNGIKVVAPTPTQPMPTSTAPATTTASTGASTAPAAAPTPPGTTPTPSKQKKLNVHALFQGGGPPSVTATPAAPSSIPSTSAPANQPPTAVPSAPRGPAPALVIATILPRSHAAPKSAGRLCPVRIRAVQHHQHPMAHPHQHHSPHPGHPMPPAPQWGPTGYYYPPPHDYNPYMYWGGHPPHQHQHHMPPIHQPPMQPSPRTQPAQPRPPSTPPATNNATPHTLPPITTSALQALPSAPSPSLSVNAPTFVPGGLRRPTNPVRISTPGGDALTFEGVPLSPKVSTPIQPKRPNVVVRMETEQQKNERLAREKEEKERLAKEKEEKERKERERIEEEKRAKEEAERKEKEEAERKAKEEADRKAEAERKAEERKAKEEEEKRIAEELRAKEEAERKVKEEEARKAREEEERKERSARRRRKLNERPKRRKNERRKKKWSASSRKKRNARLRKAEAKAKEEKAKAEAEAKAKAEVDAAKEEAEAKEAATEEARDTVPASPISSPKPPNGLLPSTIPDRPSPLSNSTTAPGRPSPLSITTSQANERPKRPVPGPLDLTSAQGNRSAAPPSALASARIIEDLNVVPYPETIKTPNPDLNIAATPGKFRYDREFLLQFERVQRENPIRSLPSMLSASNPANRVQGIPVARRQGSVGLGLGPGLAKGGFAMGNFQSPSSSQARFDASNAARSGMAFGSGAAGRLTPMSRSASQGALVAQVLWIPNSCESTANLEPVVPLEQSENRWVAGSTLRTPQQLEERQLIIEWANKSEQEKDGSTLMQVIKLVFEKAKDEAAFSEMTRQFATRRVNQSLVGCYSASTCLTDAKKTLSADGTPKEAALAAAASKAGEDKAAEAASTENGEAVLYSDEYYAAAKAKRQGLGLVRFIGELFKLQMLTERIMHECIKKLLSNVVNPEEEEIESLCKLLTTVGQSLDNPKARNHMDIYFERMQEMAKGSSINSRMQFMLQVSRQTLSNCVRDTGKHVPPPLVPLRHTKIPLDDSGRHGVSRGGSRRGEHRGANATEPDGWNVAGGAGASRPPARAGDLSQFGKISKPTGIQFGPSSVFSKKDANKRDSSIGRASGANMFSALSGGTVDGPPPPTERTANSRKPSVDLGPGGSPVVAGAGERKKLNLLPRTKPTEADNDKGDGKEEDKEEDKEEAPEDVKEYLGVENIDEAILALEALPSEHRHLFVDKLVNASMDGGNKVVVLTEKLFSAARSRSVISPEGFERGMIPTIEMADDLSIDVPKTYEWLARMIHAAGLDRAGAEEMANNISVYGEPPVPPRELLLKEFEKVSSA
ncbi:eukaryotic translation initiation factor 4G [Rhizoctonia solani]|uniref:Eukaryotic translation initiation factor 4G n=1 Tax=Rhizoctonia solani TaxID=456999 RepID=A0A8H8T1Y3_9AGAM|nr:eukaryotic translation initiation factor 4G [Rhizoctonia solani]QRW25257.1 eukaryotic translation initiation factor 4G [Rhizoctonia solani]